LRDVTKGTYETNAKNIPTSTVANPVATTGKYQFGYRSGDHNAVKNERNKGIATKSPKIAGKISVESGVAE